MVSLPDVNVLLALCWQNHVHHDAAHRWFQSHKDSGWATCALTQASFVRLSATPSVVGASVPVIEAIRILEGTLQAGRHEFWAMETEFIQIQPEIRARLAGAKQVADALLLDLAIRRAGRFATFDKRIAALLPPQSSERAAIQVIPA